MIKRTHWFGWLEGVETKTGVIEGKKSCFTIAYKDKISSRAPGQCYLTEGEQHHPLFLINQLTGTGMVGRRGDWTGGTVVAIFCGALRGGKLRSPPGVF